MSLNICWSESEAEKQESCICLNYLRKGYHGHKSVSSPDTFLSQGVNRWFVFCTHGYTQL